MLSRLTSTLSDVKLRRLVVISRNQSVEDDFEHRQAFVGDQRRIDDGADAALVLQLVVIDVEAEQAVDFFLVEDAFGARAGRSRALIGFGVYVRLVFVSHIPTR